MKTTVKHVSDTKVELTITLDQKELASAEQVALGKLARDIKVPGFRKGKVPASVAAKHVDPTALGQQTLDDALSKAVAEAFTSENIRALDRPAVDIKKFVPGQELEFTAETEILPTVKLGNYKKLGIKKVVEKVTKKDVDEILERLRTGLASRVEAARAAKDGDEVIIDFTGKRDGVPFEGGAATDYKLELGSNQFIPGFEKGVVGHKAGDEFDLDLEFPADYNAKDLAGAKVTFSTYLKEVKEVQLPELDDEFAKKAGPFKTFAELKANLEREIASTKDRQATEKLKDELIAKLVESSTIPVPEILIADQTQSIEQDMTQNLMYQGMTLDMYLESRKQTKDEWVKAEVEPAAKKRVQAGLALAELSKLEDITATDEELAEKIRQYQAQYGDKAKADFTSPELQRDIANRLITDKTIDRLVELNA